MAKNQYVYGNWNEPTDLDWVQVSPRARRFAIPGSECTVAINLITVENGEIKERPPHKHPHEQIMLILEGDGEVVVAGERFPMKAGSYIVIPPNVEHCYDASKATTNIVNIDIFTPTREEFVSRKVK